jgi:phosphomannomutase
MGDVKKIISQETARKPRGDAPLEVIAEAFAMLAAQVVANVNEQTQEHAEGVPVSVEAQAMLRAPGGEPFLVLTVEARLPSEQDHALNTTLHGDVAGQA